MTNIDQDLEDLGQRAAALELFASEPSAPYWLRAQDAEHAQQLRERQYLLLAGMRKCAADDCRTLVYGSKLCPACEEEYRANRWQRWAVWGLLALASIAVWSALIALAVEAL